ncbi:MAG: DUF1080 domain-containing protein [Flavobacteriaceae bacterium]
MKKVWILALVLPMVIACKQETKKAGNMSSEAVGATLENTSQTSSEWVTLFDGKTFEGWQKFGGGDVPGEWKIEEGAMVFYPPKERAKGAHYDINTVKTYTNFELSLEWKIAPKGNSGVFWGVSEDEKFKVPYVTGPEIQVLDNAGHPDADVANSHQAGALYDMVAPAKDVTKPAGAWNTMVIYVNYDAHEGHVDMNGERIVNFPLANSGWDEMVAKSKFADWEGFGIFKTGKIGLQDHGDVVAYRNIKIKKL